MGGPPVQLVAAMRLGAHCPHFEMQRSSCFGPRKRQSIVGDGAFPLRLDFPPTDEIASRVAQKSGTTLRFRRHRWLLGSIRCSLACFSVAWEAAARLTATAADASPPNAPRY